VVVVILEIGPTARAQGKKERAEVELLERQNKDVMLFCEDRRVSVLSFSNFFTKFLLWESRGYVNEMRRASYFDR
jgi:hypothetical protein